jgi:hypothetical protein
MEQLFRIGVKVFATKGEDIPPFEFMTVLQRWIQQHTVPGTLIDVADYSHMHQGPGIILVAHEHNTSVDYVDGRMGLLYNRKQPLDGSTQDTVRLCMKYALMAAEELQNEPEFQGRLAFDASRLQIVANDRLLAPNEDDAAARFAELVRAVAGQIFDGEVACEVQPDDARNRIAVDVRGSEGAELKAIIAQCAAQEVG